MKVDSPGGIGVTADPHKVRPGMIYVDLSDRRNHRQIYEAYVNGAALIFTPFNIQDPELPVIKVRSTRDIVDMLIDKYFGKREDQAKLVGVLGDGDKTVPVEMIREILHKGSQSGIIPVSIDTSSGSMFYFAGMNIDCVVMTDRSSFESSCMGSRLVDYLSGLDDNKAIIINNDECPEAGGFITYGLNNKAVITASSIDVEEGTCFNYCVRRSFRTRSGGRVLPFEIPVRLNAFGTHNIYNALAAITCGLYYDCDIVDIKKAVESYKAPARHFQKLYDGEFTVIDNYCSSINDYTAAFDSLQILSYTSLILIISVSQGENLGFHNERARLVAEYARNLKCKEVMLTSCMDGYYHIGELPMKTIRVYKRIFKDNDLQFRYYHLLKSSIERGMQEVEKKGLMVMLGGEEMNMAHKLMERLLVRTGTS